MNTVTENMKSINLALIEKDIANLEQEIVQKQRLLAGEKAFLAGIRALEEKGLGVVIRSVYEGVNALPTGASNGAAPPQHIRGVGEFILHLLKQNPRIETKDIMKAYANHIGSTVEDVRNNVQNTLSRLKSSKKIKNKENVGGRRAGSKWYLLAAVQSN